jgi:MarR family transcriptional regulator, lower aerobic nicotinate degradation pathway regulator
MDPSPDEYRFSDQIGHLLRRAYQRHVAIFQQTVPDPQLTAAQFVVLCTVRDRPGCDIPHIVQATAMDEDTVRGIVERLKWRKLLTAPHAPGDARATTATLTPEGAATVERTVPYAREISELTFGDLGPEERVAIVALLRKLSGI